MRKSRIIAFVAFGEGIGGLKVEVKFDSRSAFGSCSYKQIDSQIYVKHLHCHQTLFSLMLYFGELSSLIAPLIQSRRC